MDDAPRTLPEALSRAARLWPDRTAWIFDLRDGPDSTASVSLTFAEVAEGVDRVARHLRARGVRAGDRVAVLLHNRPESALAWLGLARLGATAVPLHTRLRHDDAGWILAKSRAVAIVTTTTLADGIAPVSIPVIDVGDLAGDCDADSPLPDVHDPDDIVNVQFTSGTTGHPKGCLLSHRYWLHLATSLVDGFPRLRPDDRMLTAQAMSYMDPQWNLVASLVSGASLVVLDGFHPSTFWERVREHDVTYFYCLASMPVLMLTTPPDPRDREHRVRVIQCSAIPPARHGELESRWGAPWHEVFGMTETGGDIHVTDIEHDALMGSGSIGVAKPGREARIVDAEGAEVAEGVIGELVLRGPGMMSGYDDEPEATAQVFRGGWLHTGDLARRDAAGVITLVGRLKEVVRRAGENVAAREVEDTLLSHPSVRMAAVVAVPDEIRGEEVKAYLVLTDERDARQAAQELRDFCGGHIARFKVPRYWEVRDDLPRTPSERVAKPELIAGPTWDAEDECWIGDRPTPTVLRDYLPGDEAAARAIYEASFPPSLRAPWSDLVDHRADERFVVLADADGPMGDGGTPVDAGTPVDTGTPVDAGTPVGIALIRRLGDTSMAFVRYLAVDPAQRDRGLGSEFVTHLRDTLRSAGIGVLLLDVEEPIGAHAEDDRRRIAFYQRCGLELLDVPGYSPPEHGETGELVPLLLMGQVLDAGAPLSGARLSEAVRAVLLHRYGVAP